MSSTNHTFNLSDTNDELINTYSQTKYNVYEVTNILKSFINNEEFYYKIRNDCSTDATFRAARFIYLNKTSFNGIYRVNRDGKYNVPFGRRYTIDIVDEANLEVSSMALSKANLLVQDFETSMEHVKINDLVFIDPPYTVMHENNGFVKYNQKIFSWQDQVRLAECVKSLINKKAFFILTNAYHKSILDLYAEIDCTKHIVRRNSLIGGKGAKRELIRELLITNCL